MLWGTFNGYKVGLVQSLSDLDYIRADLHANIVAGLDSETTSLSFVHGRVVGVCIATGKTYSKDDYCGYYIPIRHVGYHANLPVDLVIAFVQYVVDNYMTMWWNRSFDFSMLELDGFKAPFVGKTHDVQFMAHEIFNERYPKLKVFAKRLFGFKTIDFEDNNAVNGNFGSLDPEVSFIYAAADPLITTLCGLRIWSDYPHIRQIYPLDNESGEAVRRLAKADILLDYDFLDQEVIRTSARMEDVRQRIYQLVGYVFNISSEDDKADALSRFVTLTVRTKSGKFKVDKNILATIDHPLAKLMLEYNALSTYLRSFVSKMASWRHRQIPVHINYNLVVALTGRMSSSGSEGNDFYVPFNGQNCPKVSLKMYLHTDPLIGYCLKHEAEGAVCDESGKPIKYKTKGGLRDAFLANPPGEDDWVMVGNDYASEEIALVANMSREEGFLYPLRHDLDVHMYVAETRFHVSDPEFRDKSKAVSFGKIYGGGPTMIANRLGISKQEANKIIYDYDTGMPVFARWQKALQKQAKRTGFAKTFFGRTIYLARWFNSPDNGLRAYADRVALNSPIQGPAAPNTLILTTLGYVPIKHLYTLDVAGQLAPYGVKCWNGVRWCDFHVVDAGLGDILRFKFKRGNYVDVDVRHQFKVWTSEGCVFKDATKLSVGARVAGSLCRRLEFPALTFSCSSQSRLKGLLISYSPRTLSYEDSVTLMWWVGYALGDGSFSESNVIRFTLGATETFRYDDALAFFPSIGCTVGKLDHCTADMPGRKGECYTFVVRGVDVMRCLQRLGLDFRWRHHTKRIPWRLCCSSIAQRKALIDGLFASDGCKTEEQFMWHMCQPDILRDLQRLLRTLGFDSTLYAAPDGKSYRLVVCATQDFARFMGYPLKEQAGRIGPGRWNDRRMVPSVLCQRFVSWQQSHGGPSPDLPSKRRQSDMTLMSRLRHGGSVSFSTFESLASDYGYTEYQTWDDYLEAQEIVDIVSLPPENCYCLSLEDESHCYDTDGLISHNCLPRSLYSPSQDGKVYSPWQSFVGHRMTFQTRSDDARVGVPTFRGEHDLHVALFDTGDFCVCNLGHKFVKYGTDRVLLGLDEIGTAPVTLIPPMRKSKWGWLKGLFSGHKWTLESLLAHGKMGRDIRTDDWAVCWCMLKAFLMRKRVHTRSMLSAMILRSICDLFGWNLVYDLRHSVVDDYAFKLRWGRRRKGHAIFATELGIRDNVISPSMSSGLQTYPLCGFVHKNTGGDLIRRDLVKFERLNDLLPEWRENVRFVVTVHDEVQFRVRRKYLFKAIPIIQKVMNFWPKNFETPVVVEPGVGFRWGGELDIDAVLDDGRIVPKGYMPPPEYFEGHEVYWLRSWKEEEEKKRGLSKK
jgi:DNA polymerase I-like protein with 3'-5' exonuclease and polymerase domains